jgi:hypothetical protein
MGHDTLLDVHSLLPARLTHLEVNPFYPYYREKAFMSSLPIHLFPSRGLNMKTLPYRPLFLDAFPPVLRREGGGARVKESSRKRFTSRGRRIYPFDRLFLGHGTILEVWDVT